MYITDLVGVATKRYREPLPPSSAYRSGVRKIALIGSAPSLDCAPWHDPSWEIWAHGTCHNLCVRADRYFDLHPWAWITGKNVPGYVDFLKKTRVPVYLQTARPEVPASYTYPKDRILSEFRPYFTNHMAWMSALALTEGVTHIGLWGIHYEHDIEHKAQRACCEYWVGLLEGRGVQVVIPPGSPVTREPSWLYGYESHNDRAHVRGVTSASPTQVKPDTPLTVLPTSEMAQRPDVPVPEEIRRAAQENRAPVFAGRPAW